MKMGHILLSHLAGTRRVGVAPPASRTGIPGTSQASKSRVLGQDTLHKGSPCVYFGDFIGGGAVWKRAEPGAK